MPLPKIARTGSLWEKRLINVFSLEERGKILFTGDATDIGHYFNVKHGTVVSATKRKGRIKGKYPVRLAKEI